MECDLLGNNNKKCFSISVKFSWIYLICLDPYARRWKLNQHRIEVSIKIYTCFYLSFTSHFVTSIISIIFTCYCSRICVYSQIIISTTKKMEKTILTPWLENFSSSVPELYDHIPVHSLRQQHCLVTFINMIYFISHSVLLFNFFNLP